MWCNSGFRHPITLTRWRTKMDQYTKLTRDYFPDFCDQVISGVNNFGDKFEVKTPNIVNNPLTWVNTLIGYKNPQWRYEVAHGLEATTELQASKSEVNGSKCYVDVNTSDVSGYPSNFRNYSWRGYPYYLIPSLDAPGVEAISFARNQAIRKFIQRVNEARTSIEGGQLIGEWKETVQAITNPLGALRKFTVRHVINSKKKLRRHKRRRGKDFSKALADTYLEFVFGWIPLVKDVKYAIDGLLDRFGQPDAKRISAHGQTYYNGSSFESICFTDNFIQVYQSVINRSNVDYRITASVKTGAVNGVRSVPATLGLLPERFIPTVWELIPYSFVVDYFVNIGDIIASYAFQRSVINWGFTSYKYYTENQYSGVAWRISGGPAGYYPSVKRINSVYARGGDATVRTSSYARGALNHESLMPDLSIHLPFSNKAWINIEAILTQKFCSL